MIGLIAISCGIILLVLRFNRGGASTKLHPERHSSVIPLATLLILLGGAELLFPPGSMLLVLRLTIGLACLGLAWVVQEGLWQSTALVMGCLLMIRAGLIHFGVTP